MEEKDLEYLDSFEAGLVKEMVGLCTSLGMLDGTLLESDDINAKWKEIAPEYMAEAVPELNAFPEAAIGWAGYIGMAIAKWWDEDWGKNHGKKYEALHGKRGFDDMDDHIVQDILGYQAGSTEAGVVTKMLLSCTQLAIDKIRHEKTESQSVLAFHVFARAVRAMFKIGEAMELKQLGYRFQKVQLNTVATDRNGKPLS